MSVMFYSDCCFSFWWKNVKYDISKESYLHISLSIIMMMTTRIQEKNISIRYVLIDSKWFSFSNSVYQCTMVWCMQLALQLWWKVYLVRAIMSVQVRVTINSVWFMRLNIIRSNFSFRYIIHVHDRCIGNTQDLSVATSGCQCECTYIIRCYGNVHILGDVRSCKCEFEYVVNDYLLVWVFQRQRSILGDIRILLCTHHVLCEYRILFQRTMATINWYHSQYTICDSIVTLLFMHYSCI